MNDCAIQLLSEDDKWLEFGNHFNKEWVTFIVYAELECVLRKIEPNKEDASSYTSQQHEDIMYDAHTMACYHCISSVMMKTI